MADTTNDAVTNPNNAADTEAQADKQQTVDQTKEKTTEQTSSEPMLSNPEKEDPENTTTGSLTRADVERVREHSDLEGKRLSKFNISQKEDGMWVASVDYTDNEGSTTNGETKEFEDFALANAWVAGIAVDSEQRDPLDQEPVDDTTKL